jgi:hypothetical protein
MIGSENIDSSNPVRRATSGEHGRTRKVATGRFGFGTKHRVKASNAAPSGSTSTETFPKKVRLPHWRREPADARSKLWPIGYGSSSMPIDVVAMIVDDAPGRTLPIAAVIAAFFEA